MKGYRIRHHNEINPNEYRIHELRGTEYTVIAVGYKLKKGTATFWYWDKDIFTNRYKLVSFTRDGVEKVSRIIDL